MLEKILEKIGLSEKEAKVYLAALELGQDSVQNIAKKAGVNRPTAYFILERLMELGLASTLESGKKTVFVAENPKELETLLEREKQEMEARRDELKESMNQFLAIYNAKQGKPIVRYFEGAEGLEALDRYGYDRLKKNSESLGIAPIDVIEKYFPERRARAVKDRVKIKLKSRLIYSHENGPIPESKNKDELREVRYLPKEKLPLSGSISIFPEWGIKIFYYDHHKPYGVLIESKEIAQNMKIIFELAWTGASKIK